MNPEKTRIERAKCSTCGKKLKLSEINMCSCGLPVCSKHRYYTEHECLRKIVYLPGKSVVPTKVVKI